MAAYSTAETISTGLPLDTTFSAEQHQALADLRARRRGFDAARERMTNAQRIVGETRAAMLEAARTCVEDHSIRPDVVDQVVG
jgi:predicted outer membrane protein